MLTGREEQKVVMSGTEQPEKKQHIFDVRDFGARGDGVAVNTNAIQAAIDTCSSSGAVEFFRYREICYRHDIHEKQRHSLSGSRGEATGKHRN